jgi:23S rRNA pseudouridine1911/1915/1917 synthase
LTTNERVLSATYNPADSFCLVFSVFSKSPQNLLEFLSVRLARYDVDQLPEAFKQGSVYVDGLVAYPDQILSCGQKVTVNLRDHQEADVDSRWQILWQNDELLKVYKPALLPVSRTTRNLYQTLISLVRRETPFVNAQLLHRLDTETSGVILLAKNSAADKKWKKHLEALIVRKVYHAWVTGCPEWNQVTFECELSEKKGSEIRSQMYVVDPQERECYLKPKVSKTAFQVLQRQTDRTLIECELFTGRKHQIRAQLAYLGYPIIGDKIYSHDGRFYLKRLEQPLTDDDFSLLGAQHHLLESKVVELNTALL